MSGPDLSQLSSNWKKLQQKLQSEKKHETKKNGLKRKHPVERRKDVNGFKRVRLSDANSVKPVRGHRMGMNGSKEGSVQAKLAKEHGIAAEDISAAYGSANGISRKHVDDINGGLHPAHKIGRYLSLDCEMVGTGPPPHLDNVLARVSLVNFHGDQIYDSYVLPPPGIRVEDYRTFVSGIKPSHMVEGLARPFAEVQKDVASLLDGRILVGHALRNDLLALMLSHAKRDMRDTSRHPKFRVDSKGKPPALRNLAKSELGVEIQTGEHSSIEDARTAMMLFRKEKVGFEEEHRKHFGWHTKIEQKPTKVQTNGTSRSDLDEDDDGEDDDDLELLDGEDGDEVEDAVTTNTTSMPAAKKKRKKKKRTKRK